MLRPVAGAQGPVWQQSSPRGWGSHASQMQVGIEVPSGGAFAEVVLGAVDSREGGWGQLRLVSSWARVRDL